MTATIEQNPVPAPDRPLVRECGVNQNPDGRRDDPPLASVAGNPFDDIEVMAFQRVNHPMIRATVSFRVGCVIIHGVHVLHDRPGRVHLRLPQIPCTSGDGRPARRGGAAVTFAPPELTTAFRAAAMEKLRNEYPADMDRAAEPARVMGIAS